MGSAPEAKLECEIDKIPRVSMALGMCIINSFLKEPSVFKGKRYLTNQYAG
jgi:hypothetical protein